MFNFGQPSSASSHPALQCINRPFPTMRGDRFLVTKMCCLTLSFTKHVAIPLCKSMFAYMQSSSSFAFSDALLHSLVFYHHMCISGRMWNHWQDFVLSVKYVHKCISILVRHNGEKLVEHQLHRVLAIQNSTISLYFQWAISINQNRKP